MSITPVEKFLSSQQLFTLSQAVSLSVLQTGIDSGSLHPVIDGSGHQWFRGTEVYAYLVRVGIFTADPLGVVPDAFVYK